MRAWNIKRKMEGRWRTSLAVSARAGAPLATWSSWGNDDLSGSGDAPPSPRQREDRHDKQRMA